MEQIWQLVLGCTGFATVISMLLVIVIGRKPSYVIWGIITLYLTTLIGVAVFTFLERNK